jgi:hypothetical protein
MLVNKARRENFSKIQEIWKPEKCSKEVGHIPKGKV